MNRQEYNKKILSKLNEYVEKFPDIRFGQLLVNTNIVETQQLKLLNGAVVNIAMDPFYEESEKTWNRLSNEQINRI